MMRVVFTFFLSMCILLLGGSNHLYAHMDQSHMSYASGKTSESAVQSLPAISFSQSKQTVVRQADFPGTENNPENATEVEEDDDYKDESSRKYLELSNHFLSFFYAQVSAHTCQHHKKRLPRCEHFL